MFESRVVGFALVVKGMSTSADLAVESFVRKGFGGVTVVKVGVFGCVIGF